MAEITVIPRGSNANTFTDAKLDVTKEFSIPKADITEDQKSGSIALGPTKKILYKDQDGEVKELATVDQIEGFIKKEDISGLFPVTYSSPSSALATTASVNNLEIGEVINIPLTVTYTKRDGGDILSISLKKNENEISTSATYTDSNVIASDVPITYRAVISYSQGLIKNNQLGDPIPTGRIPAGTTGTNTISIKGNYYIAYGSFTDLPSNLRTLSGGRLSNESDTFILQASISTLKQAIVLPPNKSLSKVIDLTASNQDITSQYVLQQGNVTVNDISGNPITNYKLYIRTQGSNYNIPHNHQITLTTI